MVALICVSMKSMPCHDERPLLFEVDIASDVSRSEGAGGRGKILAWREQAGGLTDVISQRDLPEVPANLSAGTRPVAAARAFASGYRVKHPHAFRTTTNCDGRYRRCFTGRGLYPYNLPGTGEQDASL